jgi:hypothetical protein
MITLKEIKKKSLRAYPLFLKSVLLGENFFPYVLRSDKSLSNDFVLMSKQIAELMSGSKDRIGYGYQVQSRSVKTRSHGTQDIPEIISFEDQDNYLKFIGKRNEFSAFLMNVQFIRNLMPILEEWIIENPFIIISNDNKWPDLLKVCDWFVNHFEPQKYYIRELPISVHTKFIEDNKTVLGKMLDHIIPDKINNTENEFEKRYLLKYIQPLVRFRWLTLKDGNEFYDDVSLPMDQFLATPQLCSRIFIIENKMNFLTFPHVPNSIAIWGKGFAIENLRYAAWLNQKEIFYWSDLDIQGFQMLSQMRSYFPQTKAFLMEDIFLSLLEKFIVPGTPASINSLTHLDEIEKALFEKLRKGNIRLEQERIPQFRVVEEVAKLF